jgi:hypothetical protein
LGFGCRAEYGSVARIFHSRYGRYNRLGEQPFQGRLRKCVSEEKDF